MDNKIKEIDELMSKIKNNLIVELPFLTTVIIGTRIQYTKSVPTAATDGKSIKVNPDIIMMFNPKQIAFILLHEYFHIIFNHIERKKEEYNHMKWNFAIDLASNSIIKVLSERGIVDVEIPNEALYPEYFNLPDLLSSEEYYQLLPETKTLPKVKGFIDEHEYNSNNDNSSRNENNKENGGNKEKEKNISNSLHPKDIISMMRGYLPAEIQQIIEAQNRNVLDWKSILASFLRKSVTINPNWREPQKKYLLLHDIYLPSKNDKILKCVIAVDTSGSMSNNALSIIFGEINKILHAYEYEIILIQCDAKISSVEKIKYPNFLDVKNIKIIGGGGTSFIPVFDYMIQNNLNLPVIYFTDLEGEFPRYNITVPVLWITNNIAKIPPFGKKLVIYFS